MNSVLPLNHRVQTYISENPGAHARQIADALGAPRKQISSVCAKLHERGALVRENNGPPHAATGHPTYTFRVAEDALHEPLESPPATKSWADKIVDYVAAHPGKNTYEISEGIGYPRESVSSAVSSLLDQRVLVRTAGPNRRPRIWMKGASPEGEPLIPKRERKIVPEPELKKEVEEAEAVEETERAEEAEEVAQTRELAPAPTRRPIAHSFDAAIDTLAGIIAERIIERALEQITMSLETHLQPAEPRIVEGAGDLYRTSQPKEAKPSVLVVGLLPQQQAMLQSDFHRTVKLSFWKDGSLKLLQQKAGSVDHVVAMCDFVSHATTDSLKGHKDKTLLLRGGMGAVRDALASIVNGSANG